MTRIIIGTFALCLVSPWLGVAGVLVACVIAIIQDEMAKKINLKNEFLER